MSALALSLLYVSTCALWAGVLRDGDKHAGRETNTFKNTLITLAVNGPWFIAEMVSRILERP